MSLLERQWRLVDTGYRTGPENMAIDEAILSAHGRGEVPPTLRFYGWSPAAVSIGHFQSMHEEIDLEAVKAGGFGFVRRPTGGRMIFHHIQLTYSVVIQEALLPGSVLDTYRELSRGLVEGMRALGLSPVLAEGSGDPRRERPEDVNTLCFETASAYELQVGGRKVAGSAQFRKDGVRLQHGSIALDYDLPLYMSLLRVPKSVREMLLERFATKATCLQWELGRTVGYNELRDVLTAGFRTGLDLTLTAGTLTPAEEAEADRLLAEKYGNDAWNFKR